MPAVLVDQDQDTDSKEVWHLGRPLRVEAPTSLMTRLVDSPRVRLQGRDFITAGHRSQTRRFGLYCPAKTLISGDFTLRFHCVYCSSITLFNILQLGHIQINNIILKLRTTNHTIANNYNSFGSTTKVPTDFFTWSWLHHHTSTTILRLFFRDHPGELVPEENFWTLWCKGRLSEADTPTIQLGTTPSGLTSVHLHHSPHIFTGQMLFLTPNQQHQSTEGN